MSKSLCTRTKIRGGSGARLPRICVSSFTHANAINRKSDSMPDQHLLSQLGASVQFQSAQQRPARVSRIPAASIMHCLNGHHQQ